MKIKLYLLVLICFSGDMARPLQARPITMLGISELMSSAEVVVTIKPKSFRQTDDKPDDTSFGDRDLSRYIALETTCEILAEIKGATNVKNIKIIHFSYSRDRPDFNGSYFMGFLFEPTRFITFPRDEKGSADLPRHVPYAIGGPEYLAFLRRLPDGRYAAVTPQYDAGFSFRLLSYVSEPHNYPPPDAVKVESPAK